MARLAYMMELRKLVGTRPIIMVGSCVLVFDASGRLLLQRRTDSGDWGTIGGSMEPGETFEETAARELYEEAGLVAGTLTLKTVLSGPDFYYRYPHGDEIYNVMAVFEARDARGEPQIRDDEGLELRYFALEERIPDLNPLSEHVLRTMGYLRDRPAAQDAKLTVRIGRLTDSDLDLLARMNKELIEDEGHDNPMNERQLRERMQGFVETEYKAYLFEEDGEPIGYALVNHARSPLYLRQFYIGRAHRRSGRGKAAFRLLHNRLGSTDLDLEVLAKNERGRAFWSALGFEERSLYLEYALPGRATYASGSSSYRQCHNHGLRREQDETD